MGIDILLVQVETWRSPLLVVRPSAGSSQQRAMFASVLGLPHSDTRDVTVSGPLVY
jgi:hypothetical protein